MLYHDSELNSHFQKRLKASSSFFAIGPAVVGILVIIGWTFDLEFLKRIVPGLVAMNPLTAVCFILSSAVVLMNLERHKERFYFLSIFFILFILLSGVICLISSLTKFNLGIDQLLFTEKLQDEIGSRTNRMAPNTAFNFALTGISLLLFRKPNKRIQSLSHGFVLLIIAVSLLSIIGYIYGVRSFYGVLTYIPMALHTSFCFLLVSLAILLSAPDKGIMARFTNNYIGSIMARQLLPAVVAVPIILGSIVIFGEKQGLYVTHFGTALFTVGNILIFGWLIGKIQNSVNRADIARTEAEKKLHQMNDTLEERTTSLEALNKELEFLSYSISHDLKGPLKSIHGLTHILLEDNPTQQKKEVNDILHHIERNTNKMSRLIANLLEFSKARRKEMQKVRCDMMLLVKEALQEQYLKLKTKEYEIKISELVACPADPTMVAQVWVNLISNALKYSEKKERPVIEIGSYTINDENIYFIKDNGDGFDMEYSTKLFSAFQRLHTDDEFDGTGLGLAIVDRIIERHGGKVWVQAKKNEGAQFFFSLPATP